MGDQGMKERDVPRPLKFPTGWIWAYIALLGSARMAVSPLDVGWGTAALALHAATAIFVPAVAIPADRLRDRLRFRTPGWAWALLLGAGMWILTAAASWIAGTLPSILLLRFQFSIGGIWQTLLLISALAAAEELFFRAYLQEHVFARYWGDRGFGGWSLKNIASAILFGLAHMASRFSWLNPGHLIGGLICGRLVEHSRGRILPAMMLHALSNMAIQLLLLPF